MTIKDLEKIQDEVFERYFGDMFPEYNKMRKEVRQYKTRCKCGEYILFTTNVCKKVDNVIDGEPVMTLSTTLKCPYCGHYKSVKFKERA